MKRFIPILLLMICMWFTSCSVEDRKTSLSFFAMDTFMSIDAYGENSEAAEQAKNRVLELEDKLSVTDENSEIFSINNGLSVNISPDTLNLICYALEMSEKTGGALDPTIYPILREWGFTTGNYHVPDSKTLSELLENVGADKVIVNGGSISLADGVMLDLGAVAKGYASEECAKILRENGVQSALINLGGNIRLVGSRPDGNPWNIGVADPIGEGYVGILSLIDCAAVTSGNYQRYFIENDVVYGHIIDPETGIPVNNDLLSVTVIADDGTLCDALSTALFVMGCEKAEQYWRDNRDFEAVLIRKDNTVCVTSGIYRSFELDESSGSVLKIIE
ncbi:MAG: FAD:protein FMN transferase [Oscillospiraceae bacterium]|nr:FAD:protein FMN transferase [Oscillospiraceae bacterium]